MSLLRQKNGISARTAADIQNLLRRIAWNIFLHIALCHLELRRVPFQAIPFFVFIVIEAFNLVAGSAVFFLFLFALPDIFAALEPVRTAPFLIPALSYKGKAVLFQHPPGCSVVLCPTRHYAVDVQRIFRK